MNGESLLIAFRDRFPTWEIWKYKRLDPHSIEITCPDNYYIFTFYNERSWKLETK